MNRNDTDLSLPQRRAIDAMIAGRSQMDAAAEAGVSRSTLRRWLQRPHVRSAYRDAQAAAVEEAAALGLSRIRAAMETVLALMESDETPAAVRLAAAREWLSNSRGLLELTAIHDRIAALEEKAG